MPRRSDKPSPGALRNRRYRERIQHNEAIGRFAITERLIGRLLRDGEITETAAMSPSGIESGVARILKRYSEGNAEL